MYCIVTVVQFVIILIKFYACLYVLTTVHYGFFYHHQYVSLRLTEFTGH